MSSVRIYTKTHCPYSLRAKALLNDKSVEFEEVDIQQHPDRREEMIAAAGGSTTVPQVFIGERHVGGATELEALEKEGRLDELLGAGASGSQPSA